ncbi:hypothetical protein JW978_00065 [Candidatus Dojkabacteria bacterium]|nr:hypothetical protein [Candidatus Dojkabacteria bacterium]
MLPEVRAEEGTIGRLYGLWDELFPSEKPSGIDWWEVSDPVVELESKLPGIIDRIENASRIDDLEADIVQLPKLYGDSFTYELATIEMMLHLYGIRNTEKDKREDYLRAFSGVGLLSLLLAEEIKNNFSFEGWREKRATISDKVMEKLSESGEYPRFNSIKPTMGIELEVPYDSVKMTAQEITEYKELKEVSGRSGFAKEAFKEQREALLQNKVAYSQRAKTLKRFGINAHDDGITSATTRDGKYVPQSTEFALRPDETGVFTSWEVGLLTDLGFLPSDPEVLAVAGIGMHMTLTDSKNGLPYVEEFGSAGSPTQDQNLLGQALYASGLVGHGLTAAGLPQIIEEATGRYKFEPSKKLYLMGSGTTKYIGIQRADQENMEGLGKDSNKGLLQLNACDYMGVEALKNAFGLIRPLLVAYCAYERVRQSDISDPEEKEDIDTVATAWVSFRDKVRRIFRTRQAKQDISGSEIQYKLDDPYIPFNFEREKQFSWLMWETLNAYGGLNDRGELNPNSLANYISGETDKPDSLSVEIRRAIQDFG